MNAQTPFSFVSLNINGTKDKDLLISELLENDIVFLQEHLLSKVNVDSLKRSRTHYTFLRAAQKPVEDHQEVWPSISDTRLSRYYCKATLTS